MNLAELNTFEELSENELSKSMKSIELKLMKLQRQIADQGIPVFVLIDGLSTAGKSACISHLVQAFDPRFYRVASGIKMKHQISWLQPFWDAGPAKGSISFFDRSWYRIPFHKETAKEGDGRAYFAEALEFEKKHLLNGALVIKVFLNISEKTQAQRLKSLEANKKLSWRVDKHDFEQNKNFKKFQKAADEMIERSNFPEAPWRVIPADNPSYAFLKASEYLLESMTKFLAAGHQVLSHSSSLEGCEIPRRAKLKSLDISKKDYEKQLPKLQRRLQELSFELYKKKRSAILLFEGWDAAGKGGAIKRLLRHVDPRNYRVCPVAAPSSLDKKHHYMWRFWTQFPDLGNLLVFDRTWYGRVLVERVEGFCSENEWQRAYDEIALTEKHLNNEGVIVVKFWLDIDKAIQKERFDLRLETEHKAWKITEEDWRNREKWDQYDDAVNEMIFRTSRPGAQWKLIEGNHKKYARIQVLKHTIKTFEKALKDS
jgi:AMP-polyphosphate phosphotransferase